MKDLKTVEQLVEEMIINTVVDKLSLGDVHELVKAAQKDAIEVAMSRATEEFKIREVERIGPMSTIPTSSNFMYEIDPVSIFECKDKLLISLS